MIELRTLGLVDGHTEHRLETRETTDTDVFQPFLAVRECSDQSATSRSPTNQDADLPVPDPEMMIVLPNHDGLTQPGRIPGRESRYDIPQSPSQHVVDGGEAQRTFSMRRQDPQFLQALQSDSGLAFHCGPNRRSQRVYNRV